MNENINVLRSEKKYYLPLIDSISLQEDLQKLLQVDEHSKDGTYVVRSLYFDSINDIDYFEKDAGNKDRKKIRLRVYGENDQSAKLELKEKDGDFQRKYSLLVSREQAILLQNGDYSVLLDIADENGSESAARGLALNLFSIMTLGLYSPVSLIEYDRRAFIYDEFNTRITIDQNVRCDELNLDVFTSNPLFNTVLQDEAILEVKYKEQLFKPISKLLRKYNITNISYSKYGNGRLLMEPYILS